MIQDRLKIKKLRAGDLAPDVMLGRQTLLNCAAFKGYGQVRPRVGGLQQPARSFCVSLHCGTTPNHSLGAYSGAGSALLDLGWALEHPGFGIYLSIHPEVPVTTAALHVIHHMCQHTLAHTDGGLRVC